MNKGTLIMVDGVDATGKSTLCQGIAAVLPNAIVFHNPKGLTDISNTVYETIKRNPHMNEEVKKALIAATHIENTLKVDELIRGGTSVIVDRTVMSFYAYQEFYDMHDFTTYLDTIGVPQTTPDKFYYLTASPDIIRERMISRGNMDSLDRYFLDNMEHIVKMYDEASEYLYGGIKRIDTSIITQEEVLACVMSDLL